MRITSGSASDVQRCASGRNMYMYSSLGDDDIFPLILPSVCDCVLSRYNFLS